MTIAAFRFNNPFNVSLPIAGYNGPGSIAGINGQPGYGSFPDMGTGFAAGQQRLQSYITGQNSHGAKTTINQLNSVYATDPNWARGVAKYSGLDPNEKLDPNNPDQMAKLQRGVLSQELGPQNAAQVLQSQGQGGAQDPLSAIQNADRSSPGAPAPTPGAQMAYADNAPGGFRGLPQQGPPAQTAPSPGLYDRLTQMLPGQQQGVDLLPPSSPAAAIASQAQGQLASAADRGIPNTSSPSLYDRLMASVNPQIPPTPSGIIPSSPQNPQPTMLAGNQASPLDGAQWPAGPNGAPSATASNPFQLASAGSGSLFNPISMGPFNLQAGSGGGGGGGGSLPQAPPIQFPARHPIDLSRLQAMLAQGIKPVRVSQG